MKEITYLLYMFWQGVWWKQGIHYASVRAMYTQGASYWYNEKHHQ